MSSIHIERLEQCKAIATYTNKLASPLVIDDEVYCVAENGDILKLKKEGGVEVVFTILGQPSSLAFKDGDNLFLISDFAHQSIFSRDESSNLQINHLITEYNNHAFLGPNSIKVGPFTSNSCIIQRTSTSLIPDPSRRHRSRADWAVSSCCVPRTRS
jgi:hypothetical protein